MTAASRTMKRLRQPSGPIELSRQIPRGLVTANTYAGVERSLVGSQVYTRAGSGHAFTPMIGRAGDSAVGLTNAGTGYFSASVPNRTLVGSTAGNAFSFFFTLRLNATGQTNKYIAQEYNSGGGGQAAFIYGYVANTFEIYSNNFTGTDPRSSSAIAAPSDTRVHTVGYTYDGATLRGYLDGAEVLSNAIVFTLPSYTAGYLLSAIGGANIVDATILQHVVFDRAVPTAWAREYTANPWGLAASRRLDQSFAPPTVGAGATISVPTGAVSVAGYAPTVTATANQTISVPAGSVALTGYAPTVSASASQTIAVPVGAVSLTGYAPSVFTTAVTTIAVPAGAVSLAGFAPTISYTTHAYIDVPKGAVTLTGYAPTVTGGESSIWTPVTTDSAVWSAQSVSAATWTPQ